MSKLNIMRARIRRISRYARLCVRHYWCFQSEKEERKDPRDGHLLSANTATGTNGEGLRGFFVIGCVLIIAKPAFRDEDVWIFEVQRAAMSRMGAELHVCLDPKISKPRGLVSSLTPPGTH